MVAAVPVVVERAVGEVSAAELRDSLEELLEAHEGRAGRAIESVTMYRNSDQRPRFDIVIDYGPAIREKE